MTDKDNNESLQRIVDRMIEKGILLPEYREEALEALDKELRRRARRVGSIWAGRAMDLTTAEEVLKSLGKEKK